MQMLANLAGYSRYEALGRLAFLWDHCVGSGTELLDERRVLAFLGVPAAVLVDSGLAEHGGDGVRIRGVREEVDAKRRRTEHARAAGLARAKLSATPQTPQLGASPQSARSKPGASSELFPRAKSDLFSDLSSSEASSSSETSGDLKQQRAGQRRRATQLPAGFAPDDGHRRFAAEKRLDLAAEFEAFTDFHKAKGSTFLDWPAALRTWLRNAVKFGGGRGATPGSPTRPAPPVLSPRPRTDP